MDVILTRNLNKRAGWTNGLVGVIRAVEKSIVFLDCQGTLLPVHLWADEYTGGSAYPLQPAYACTLAKVQGRTMEHLTLLTDVLGVPAAGYVSMTRVRCKHDLLFLRAPDHRFWVPVELSGA